MPYKRGQIVLVFFPDSNLRTAKRRPALVVQADNLATGLAQTIVAMVTSNMARAGHPSRVTLEQKLGARPTGGNPHGLRNHDGQPCDDPRNGD
jgi:mRNA-degrading endonuclease toxin of MazEF toxin-antitoxin module